MSSHLLPRAGRSSLLVIDVQERLLAAMPDLGSARLVKACVALIELAKAFDWPIACTEQYPKGLGPTVPPLLEALGDRPRTEKIEFSALQNPTFVERVLPQLGEDVVLAGVETHVCVLQTAIDLRSRGFNVFLPRDAALSRSDDNWSNGLALIERTGAVVTNSETVIFGTLGKAEGERFRALSKLVR